ncbi:hypothetical protein EOD42_09905 [Rhodovarius crocodyli]|uniref:Uncharacterized protein n=2 Tax=Rhodovarius crocodyli TaxID=1979269 RepID=A0A437MHK9_9PROT|nr:hypothetical protein EOD42_09905 [Rhodovarius crocodyli]
MDAPTAFRRYAAMGGVLDFSVREDAQGSRAEILAALAQLLGEVDVAALRPRPIERDSFLGDWHDAAQGLLLKRGEYVTADGVTLVNPPFTLLEGVRIRTGMGQVPEMGAGGQFAYAFAEPPYPLTAPPGEVQAAFAGIRDFILPPGQAAEILDWSSPELARVAPYFEQGAEWWGMFLFSIHVPALKRLTIIAGSATD